MTSRKSVVSLVAALVVLSVLAPAMVWTAGAQEEASEDESASGLVVESLDAPGAVSPDSTITVNATVSNPTDEEVTEDVAFRLSGDEQDIVIHKSVTVGPDETATVNFTLETTDFGTGDYIHGVTTANSSKFAELEVTTAASVTFTEQESNGTEVVVDSVFVPEGGYVTIHDARLLEGDAVGSAIGVSEHLEAGYHENVTVTLFDVPGGEFNESELTESQILIAMPHLETGNNTTYDFVTSNGTEDGPYTADGQAVTMAAPITISGTATDGATGNETAGNETAGDDDTAGDESNGNETDSDEGDDGSYTLAPSWRN